jgi:SAM-dependent methyltransferase
MNVLQSFKNSLKGVFVNDYVVHKGVVLPPTQMRLMGEKFYDNDYYLNSSLVEGDRLKNDLGVNKSTRMLEIGSSSGRSVIGLVQKVGPIAEYVGVDTKLNNVFWCNNHIAKKFKYCRFVHLDIKQIMFNPKGTVEVNENFHYPFQDDYFDLVYLNSVLPNNIDSEIKIYAKDFIRILKPGGKLFLTTFIEENVPPMTENPDNYVMVCTYPRQIVRFEKKYFIKMFTDAGFKLSNYSQGTEIDTQSAVLFVK